MRKGGLCPVVAGMRSDSGYIYFDDEDDNNRNELGGSVPDGSYGRDTGMHYCRLTPCSTDL